MQDVPSPAFYETNTTRSSGTGYFKVIKAISTAAAVVLEKAIIRGALAVQSRNEYKPALMDFLSAFRNKKFYYSQVECECSYRICS